ncbi:ATP-binding protein [Vibrio sp. SCSIO 43136]|uniref:hybrid sensor histidine kinase/response regulator n=1 Tax=Vibrio sp. SCSIO 43136 TaxID=2819101 RepID=UPI002075CFB7|nr:ATP-binding protein [Vibrio sp. SCSIO 43136]USD65248.1 response regulator [Vibrio sp. SCSIO 43136]
MKMTVQRKLLAGFLAITIGSTLASVLNLEALHTLGHKLTRITTFKMTDLENAIRANSAIEDIAEASIFIDQQGTDTLLAQYKSSWHQAHTALSLITPESLQESGLTTQKLDSLLNDYLEDLTEIDHLMTSRQMIVNKEHKLLSSLDKLEPELNKATKTIQAYFESADIRQPSLSLSRYEAVSPEFNAIMFEDMSTMSLLNTTAYNLNALYQVMLRVISAEDNRQLAKLQLSLVQIKTELDHQFTMLRGHFIGQSLLNVYQELMPFMVGEESLIHLKRRKLRFTGVITGKLSSHQQTAMQLLSNTSLLVSQREQHIRHASEEIDQLTHTVAIAVIASSIIAFLASLFVVYGFIGRNIAHPIREMAQAMRDIANGKKVEPLNQNRNDEIGDMAAALEILSCHVQRVKEAEIEKHQQQQLLNTILDSVNALVMVRDASGTILLSNNYCQSIKDWRQLDSDYDLSNETNFNAFEETLQQVSGIEHQYLTQLVPLKNDAQEIYGLIRLSTDISQQKAYEHELAEAKDDAEASTKAKSEFLAAMSHEIRTPLNGVLGTLEMLSLTDMNLEQRDYINTVNESSQALLSIINDILDFSKIEAGKLDIEPVPTDIRSTIETVAHLHNANLRDRELEMRVFIAPALSARLSVDDIRLRQVLENLVSNAVKFTRQGYIALEAQVLCDNLHTQMISISVTDTGIGIAKAVQDSLFQQFTQAESSTTRQYGGTGLGLAICYRLCELMGIKLSLESEQGAGSRFTLTMELPKHSQGHLLSNDSQSPIYLLESDSHLNQTVRSYLKQFNLDFAYIDQNDAIERMSQASSSDGLFIIDFANFSLLATQNEKQIEDWLNSLEARILVLHPNRSLWTDTQTFVTSAPLKPSLLHKALKQHIEATEQPSEATPSYQPDTTTDLSSYHLLVAEDNEMNQRLIVNQLKHFKLEHTLVENGQEAMSLLQQSWLMPDTQQYDALLTDCHMPIMDGYQLANEIRRHEPLGQRLPIIALTANALVGESKKCLDAGMDDFLSKPVKLAYLNSVLAKWLTSSSTPSNL